MSVSSITETRQYLTFKLEDEIFAVDVANVREIFDFVTVTKVPTTPDYMMGVINLRGSVVPVIDMRLKFGMSRTERTENTCIVVIEIHVDQETAVLGAVADSVQEVIELEPELIEPVPRVGSQLNIEFIKGMGKRDSQFIMILDTDRIFSIEELNIVSHHPTGQAA